MKIHYKLGEEIGVQLKEVLSIRQKNPISISKIIDFIHEDMNVKGSEILNFINVSST